MKWIVLIVGLILVQLVAALQCRELYSPYYVTQKTMPKEAVYVEKTCWAVNTREGKQAESLNAYFLQIRAGAFFTYNLTSKEICISEHVKKLNTSYAYIMKKMKEVR